jgi:hypothetical protein
MSFPWKMFVRIISKDVNKKYNSLEIPCNDWDIEKMHTEKKLNHA